MIAFDRSFASYVDRVLLARDITPDYAGKVRYSCRKFCEWLGCDPGIDGLDPAHVNEFLFHLKASGKRPDTVAGYRRAILVVWNEAYRAGDTEAAPLRVRPVRTPRCLVTAFTQADIRRLLTHVAGLVDYMPNGIRRRDFWTAAIHAAYSTGLRRGDLLRLRRDAIGADGVARVLQSKTGYPITVRVSREALAAMDRMRVDDRALPWPYHVNAFARQFRRIAAAAGVPGQFRWLRRSAASYAEREEVGRGSRLLGHRTASIFGRHYADAAIIGERPAEPPPL